MPEKLRKGFVEIAKRLGDKTELWAIQDFLTEDEPLVSPAKDSFSPSKSSTASKEAEEAAFDSRQLTPTSEDMPNNCIDRPNLTKCLECDFQVSYILDSFGLFWFILSAFLVQLKSF